MITVLKIPTASQSGGASMMIGFTVVAAFVIAFFAYVLPTMRNNEPFQTSVPEQMAIPRTDEIAK